MADGLDDCMVRRCSRSGRERGRYRGAPDIQILKSRLTISLPHSHRLLFCTVSPPPLSASSPFSSCIAMSTASPLPCVPVPACPKSGGGSRVIAMHPSISTHVTPWSCVVVGQSGIGLTGNRQHCASLALWIVFLASPPVCVPCLPGIFRRVLRRALQTPDATACRLNRRWPSSGQQEEL